MYTILITFISALYLVYYYFTRNNDYWKKRNVAGPKPLPFFGNMKDSTLRTIPQNIIIKGIYDQYTKEKVVGIFRMKTPTLLIRDLDIIKQVMIKDFDQFMDRGVEFDPEGLGANLFHADGDKWQILRNKFTPIFTSGKLKHMFPLMTERGDKFIDYVKNISSKKTEHNIYRLVQHYTVTTIAACAFGMDIEMDDKILIPKLYEINNLIFTLNRGFDIDLMFPGLLKTFSGSIFPKQLKSFFYDLSKNISAQRNGVPSNRKDFMDLLLEMKQQKQVSGFMRHKVESLNVEITDGLIAAQCFVFYAAGFETSATTMAYLLYEIAKNPEIQDKLIEEIDRVMGKTNGEVTYDCLAEMTYLTKVFEETLRMYPIVDLLQRVATENYTIPDSNTVIEKGKIVLVSSLGIHHDEQYYPNPEKFDPERFNPENSGNRHPCAYLPFGVGPRNCIGMRFAKVQTRICVIKLLSNFKVTCSPNTKKTLKYDPMSPLLHPLGGIPLNLMPRVK